MFVSNNILTCESCNPGKLANPPGGSAINDSYVSKYIDIDNDPSTFSSSSADLNLPDCSEISFAGLYWGGAAVQGAPGRDRIKLKLPSSETYIDLIADKDFGTFEKSHYQYFKDITSLVSANKRMNGTYTVADQVASQNVKGVEAGWSIVIVYKNESKPHRNLTVFDGFAGIPSGSPPLNINISGFMTPPVGPVNFELGFVAYEGDRGLSGDYMRFNNVTVSDASHEKDNTFNSSISYNGKSVTTRSPAHPNTLGYDASIMMPDNSNFTFLRNSATSAKVTLATDDDRYSIGVVTTAIDTYNPYFQLANSYSNVTNPGGSVAPGDILEMIYEARNIGNDISVKTLIEDELPSLLRYVPNSMQIEGVAATDIFGDDVAEYISSEHKVVFRVGSGADKDRGGEVPIGSAIKVRYLVQVTSDCYELNCANGEISNDGVISYYGKVNNATKGCNVSGPAPKSGSCTAGGLIKIDVETPVSCSPPSDISRSVACATSISQLDLPEGFSVYESTDEVYSNPLTIISSPGTYIARKLSAAGCEFKFNLHISFDPIVINALVKDISCAGAGDGSLDLVVTGGTGRKKIEWFGPNDFASGSQSLKGLVAGEYTVKVTESTDCSSTKSFTINEPARLEITGKVTNPKCFGDEGGAITITTTGGAGDYTYSWIGPEGFSSASEDVTDLKAGSYRLIATDANGCIAEATFTVTEPEKLLAQATQVNLNCFNGEDGSIDITVTGGTGSYLYSWTGPEGFISSIEDLTGLKAGNYELTVRDTSGCSFTENYSITQPDAPLKISFNKEDVNCFGESSGSIELSVTGGTAPYTYHWVDGENTKDRNNLKSGIYEVKVTDSIGCFETASIAITEPTSTLQVTVSTKNVSCYGANDGRIDLTVTGGTGPYEFYWDNTVGSKDVQNLQAGLYNMLVKDAKGCTAAAAITITQPQNPLKLSSTKTDAKCFGSATGSIDLKVEGGTAPYSFKWTNGAETEDLLAIPEGEYRVEVRDATGCSSYLSVTITQPDPLAVTYDLINADCANPAGGSIGLNITGGKKPYTITWVDRPDLNSDFVNNLSAGIYRVRVVAASGCSKDLTIEVRSNNCSPIADDDRFTISRDEHLSQSVATNDNDPDGDRLFFEVFSQPSNGTLRFSPNGDFTFVPKPGWIGETAFTYSVCDSKGVCDTATVIITVKKANSPPTAGHDIFSISQGIPLSADVSLNDSDPDADILSYEKINSPENGSLTMSENGTFIYTPFDGFSGTDVFTYQVCDPLGECSSASVTIDVAGTSVVNLTPGSSVVLEGETAAITAKLERPFSEDVTITVAYSGTALRERDYFLLDHDRELTIRKGETSSTGKISVSALKDLIEEDDETVIITITSVSSPSVKIGTGAQVVIQDVFPVSPPADSPSSTPLTPPNKDIVIHNLVSPNGDGKNDFFLIENLPSGNEVVIFNRWGNEVYRQKDYNQSDKVFRGVANAGLITAGNAPLSDGVYYFLIYSREATGNGQRMIDKGYLILKR